MSGEYPPLSKAPVSAPVWMWIAYAAIITTLGVLSGSVNGFGYVFFAAAFSFQFWTFAAHHGMRRYLGDQR